MDAQGTVVQELPGGQMSMKSSSLSGSGFSVFVTVVCKLLKSSSCPGQEQQCQSLLNFFFNEAEKQAHNNPISYLNDSS